jgi:hypothetical protein
MFSLRAATEVLFGQASGKTIAHELLICGGRMNDLLIMIPEEPQQNTDKELYSIAMRLKNKEWVIPDFQRKFSWNSEQVKGWIDSIEKRKAIGVIVTYQIRGGGAIYIADGLQRLTATLSYIEDPERYGCSYGEEQAKKNCESFSITVQHRIYENHKDAMNSFQKLNKGTALTPLEFYMGELTLDDVGKIIVDRIPSIVEKYEAPLLRFYKGRATRKLEHQRTRDSYALFLQYISGTEQMDFWDVAVSVVADSNRNIVERELSEFVTGSKWKRRDCESSIGNFEKYIADQVVEIRTLLDESGGKGLAIGITVLRWLLHLSIWKKNTKRNIYDYEELVKKMFSNSIQKYGSIISRFELPNTTPVVTVTLTMNGLGALKKICRSFDSRLYEGSTRKKKAVAAGYHDSHVLPFSTNGNGETFPEAGPRNMARGARPAT